MSSCVLSALQVVRELKRTIYKPKMAVLVRGPLLMLVGNYTSDTSQQPAV